jgi:predicted dithiol-disulfide oxidoreductase (DUF899 family)
MAASVSARNLATRLNKETTMTPQAVVSRQDWLVARKALLAEERALTHARDEIAKKRRALPWVKIEKSYIFDAPAGKVALADLFAGRSQLAVYHFMLAPDSDHVCPGCSFLSDHVDAARQHFEHADLSFAAVSRAPLKRTEAVRRRLGWRFPWGSSAGTDFNYDFGVSFTKQDIAGGRAVYNYDTPITQSEDMHGTSIFVKDDAGAVYHTYSTYARGDEPFLGAFNWLDLTPQGRNEIGGVMSWVRLHDEYTDTLGSADCCGTKPLQKST